MKITDEKEIIALIQNPVSRDFGYRQLILAYQKRVYHVIRSMVLIHEDADDLTQNTFIKAYRHIDNFQGKSSLFTWLYRIATNEALSFLEKKKKRFFFSIDDHQERMESYLAQSGNLSGDEIQKILQRAILKLPAKPRLVFHLKYQE